jgi:hypothetical protein
VPSSVGFEEAGLDEVQHFRGVVGRTPSDPRPARRLEERVAQWEALTPERIAEAVAVSRAHAVAHTPTLVMYARGARMDAWAEQAREPALVLLPRFYAEATWNPQGMPWFEGLAPTAPWRGRAPSTAAASTTR